MKDLGYYLWFLESFSLICVAACLMEMKAAIDRRERE